jgi:hypothetical protein
MTGAPHVTREELGILDLSRAAAGAWIPPIGAMGGPPAHELYRDLVVHAGLRLLRDSNGRPWAEIQDGAHRRSFPVPSLGLREALDRFRMRRNLRPVPEDDIIEFARVVEARVSDPDVQIPSPEPEREATAPERKPDPAATAPFRGPPQPGAGWAVDELDHLMREVDAVRVGSPPEDSTPKEAALWSQYAHPVPLHSRLPHRWHASVSGGQRTSTSPEEGLPRYIRVLRDLVQEGSWIGSIGEIARRTGDDADRVFATLLQYHSDLVGEGLVVAPVEVEEGWRWLIVDRSRMRTTSAEPDLPD